MKEIKCNVKSNFNFLSRLKVTSLQEEVDKNKELYVTLSQEKENLKIDYDKRLENFQQRVGK